MFTLFAGRHVGVQRRYTNMAAANNSFLQSKDVRIIIGLMYEDQFRKISCQVMLDKRLLTNILPR